MPMSYPKAFRERTVARLLSPNGPTVMALAQEIGVSRASLYRWKDEYFHKGKVSEMGKKRSQDWSAEEKFQAVLETANLNEEDLGAYCRRNGLHVSTLKMWRETCLSSIRKGPKVNPEAKALKKENQELKRDLRRKEKALAEATALLVLKKKVALIWGNADGEGEADA